MKDLLTVGQLELFARACGGAADFVVVDLRAAASAVRAHRRPWALRGWRLTVLAAVDAAEIARLGLPVAIVCDAGEPPALAASLYELAADVRAFIHQDGRLSLGGEAQVALPAPPAGVAALVLTLDREERVTPVELPFELTLELDGAADTTRVLGLRLESGAAAPPAAWYRLDAAGAVTLRVDVAPERDGDRWRLTLTSGQLVASARPEEPNGAAPERLAVILDRTCPDADGWSGARATGVAGRARAADPFAKVGGADAGGHRDLNRAVREGLERALAEALAGRDVVVDAWSFADVPGDGLSPLEGVDHPDGAVQALGTGGAEVPGRFAAATYAPGLDVWDPLDEALEQALETLAADRGRRGAVLMVGNSPPQVLPAPGTPFAALASAAGCVTVARRWSPTWELALERCRAVGVRLAYAFLEHPVFKGDEQREHELHARLARRVREGLEASLPVTRGPANEEGTRRAVTQALAVLASAPPRPCGLRWVRRSS